MVINMTLPTKVQEKVQTVRETFKATKLYSFDNYSALFLMSGFIVFLEVLSLTRNIVWVTQIIQNPLSTYVSSTIILLAVLGMIGIHYQKRSFVYLLFLSFAVEFIFGLLFIYYLVMTDIIAMSLLPLIHGIIVSFISFVGIVISYQALEHPTLHQPVNQEFVDALNNKFKSEYTVEMIDVHKIYTVGDIKVHALRGINLKVKRGEFVAIMGPSGSGKSTLLNLLGALDKPTSGKVIIDGVDISTLSNDQLAKLRNEKIGFIFQSYNLINRSKVIRNIELPAIVKGMPKEVRIKKALELLKVLGLEGLHNRRPKHLSGGQQQRVAIARALINNPQIILADEPTGNLDSVSGREVMKYLRKMNEEFGTTVIVVTHDREVGEMADKILHIKDGKIVGEEIIRRDKYDDEK